MIGSFSQPAFAATQLRGSISKSGPVNNVLANDLCKVNTDCYFCIKFRLKALANVDTGSTEKEVSFTLWERWLGVDDYACIEEIAYTRAINAPKGAYWPGGNNASEYKKKQVPTEVSTNYYYQTKVFSNMPTTIEGYYESWLATNSNGT